MDRVLKFDHEFIGRAAVEAEIAERRAEAQADDVRGRARSGVAGRRDRRRARLALRPDGDQVVGWITSGGYAHYCGVSLAWGYIPTELAQAGTTGFEIEIIGNRRPARLQLEPILDPAGHPDAR